MASAPTNTYLTEFPNPPPFPASPRSVDFSPLEFILALLAIITIPALVYAFLFSLRCPPRQFGRPRNNLQRSDSTRSPADDEDIRTECSVCLSVLADGQEIKQLSACKHSFHASCIDEWLKSHSDCPICRASVPVNRPNGSASSTGGGEDRQQGLPDAASLV